MPSEVPNLIFLGARLATITTCRPIRVSGLYEDLMPANTVLFSLPMSSSSFSSFSDPSTWSALKIKPIRRSILENWSIVICLHHHWDAKIDNFLKVDYLPMKQYC